MPNIIELITDYLGFDGKFGLNKQDTNKPTTQGALPPVFVDYADRKRDPAGGVPLTKREEVLHNIKDLPEVSGTTRQLYNQETNLDKLKPMPTAHEIVPKPAQMLDKVTPTIQEVAPKPKNKPKNLYKMGSPQAFIHTASLESGIDNDILLKIAKAESSLDPTAQAKTSSAGGLYQFIDSTWKGMVDKYGEKYGIDETDKMDPHANALMGALFIKDNANYIKKRTGKKPDARDLYLAHFSGAGTAVKAIKAIQDTPNAPADSVWSKGAIKANKSIFYKNQKLRTVSEVYKRLTDKVA